MAQTPALLYQSDGNSINHTPGSAVTAGDVVLIGTVPAIAPNDIAASTLGSVSVAGLYKVPKTSDTFTAGDAVYWDADGTPVTGTASSGAADSSAATGNLMGFATADAASGVSLTAAKRTATIAGSVTADDITASDSSLGVNGAAAAQGGAIVVTGGTSSTAGNAGGAVSLVGGTPGTTGAGGAASVTGGIGGATSGTGGAVAIAGGAGTAGNANGGAVTILGGNAHGSGTDGAIAIGSSNTSSVTFGVMPRIPTATVAAAGTVQADAAAITEGFTLVTGSTNAGVKLPAAVAGMQVIIKNNVAGNMKVWPNSSDAINAIAADSAFTMATVTCCMFVAYDATTWYSLPLVAS